MERTNEDQEETRRRKRMRSFRPDGSEGSRPELDALLRWADQRCVYERLLVWAWLLPVCLLTPCAYMTVILMVYAPPHTCATPEPPRAISSHEWRNLTLPRDDAGNFKSCQMYDYAAAIGDSLEHRAQYASAMTVEQTPMQNPVNPTTRQEDGGEEREEEKAKEERHREKKGKDEEKEKKKKKKEKEEEKRIEEREKKEENKQEEEEKQTKEREKEEKREVPAVQHPLVNTSQQLPNRVAQKGTLHSGNTETTQDNYKKAVLIWREQHPDTLPENVTDCQFGYAFDTHYFTATATTEFEWVCAEEYSATRVLQASMFGNLVGCLIFGPLADRIGRRRTFLLLAVKVAVLGSVFVLLRNVWVMLLVRFKVSLGLPIIYQIVIISASEQVRDERRGTVTALSSVFFSLGQCLMALVSWLTGDWVKLGLITSLPAFLALVYVRVIEESPRWLMSRGRIDEAAKVLLRIAKMNRVEATQEEVLARLRKACASQKEQTDRNQCMCAPSALLALVPRYPRLTIRILLVALCWTVNLMMYFSTTLSYSNVFANPFLGWFFTSVVEIPANLLVMFLLGRMGRRALHVAVMTVCAVSLLVAAALLAMGYEATHIGVAAPVLLAKFCSAMTFLVMYLQAAELSPTPVRSCVTGFASLVASSFNLVTPVIMMSSEHSYLILGSLATTGVILAIFLPETAKRPLPQTLEDAEGLTIRGTSLPKDCPQESPPSAGLEDDPHQGLAETSI